MTIDMSNWCCCMNCPKDSEEAGKGCGRCQEPNDTTVKTFEDTDAGIGVSEPKSIDAILNEEFLSKVHPDNITYLSDKDMKWFIDLIENPPKPNQKLIDLMKDKEDE